MIIWYFFEGNDLYDDQEFENAMLAAPPSAEDRSPNAGGFTRFDGWARRSFVLNAFQRLRWIFHPIVPNRARFRALLPRPAGPPLPIYFGPEASLRWTSYEDGRWATATRAFETGVGFARDRKLPVMLVFVPYKYRVFRDFITDPRDEAVRRWAIWPEFPAKFLELCRTLAVPCLDATGVLTEALRNGLLVYGPTDTHWSAEGHGVVAEELERRLKALRWVP